LHRQYGAGLFSFNGAGLMQWNWCPSGGAHVARDFQGISGDQALMGG
jgi:hypothetical protein